MVFPACNPDEVLDLALVEPYAFAFEAIIHLDIGKLKGHQVARATRTFHIVKPLSTIVGFLAGTLEPVKGCMHAS
jgi:hypothetical protein